MQQKALRYLLWSQLSLAVFLIMCICLLPHFLFSRNEGGVSNYGVHGTTVVPYSLAFIASAGCVLTAANLLSATAAAKMLRIVLRCFAAVLLLVLASTYSYKLNHLLDDAHIATAILLACFDMGAAIWLVLQVKNSASFWLFGMQTLGFVLAVATYVGKLHVLLLAQLIIGTAFGTLLVRSGGQIIRNQPR